MKITLTELRHIIRQEIKTTMMLNESLLGEGVRSAINKYIKWTKSKNKIDIKKSWGNCAFYTKDFFNFCKATGRPCKIIYMPLANPTTEDAEDHIVPVFNNHIIDFAKVPHKGVAKHDRESTKIPTFNPGISEDSWPRVSENKPELFTINGLYGKLGYLSNSNYAEWIKEIYDLSEEYPIIMDKMPYWVTVFPPSKK